MADVDFKRWMLDENFIDQLAQTDKRWIENRANRDSTENLASQGAGSGRQVFHAGKNRLCVTQQRGSCSGQLHPAVAALKKRQAELAFKALDLAAHGWLAHVKALRGARQVTLSRNDHERS